MISFADLFRKARDAFRRDWKLMLLASFLSGVPGMISDVLDAAGVIQANRWPGSALSLVFTLISMFFIPGVTIICLKLLREEKAEPADLVRGFRYAGKYVGAALLCALIPLGYLLFMASPLAAGRQQLPTWALIGLSIALLLLAVWSILLMLFYPLIPQTAVDRDTKGPISVMRCSREMLRGHRWQAFMLFLLLAVLLVPQYLISRISHPAALVGSTLLSVLWRVIQSLLVCAFYEAIKPVEKRDPGLRNRLRKAQRKAARKAQAAE